MSRPELYSTGEFPPEYFRMLGRGYRSEPRAEDPPVLSSTTIPEPRPSEESHLGTLHTLGRRYRCLPDLNTVSARSMAKQQGPSRTPTRSLTKLASLRTLTRPSGISKATNRSPSFQDHLEELLSPAAVDPVQGFHTPTNMVNTNQHHHVSHSEELPHTLGRNANNWYSDHRWDEGGSGSSTSSVQRISGHNSVHPNETTSRRLPFRNINNASPAKRYLMSLNSRSVAVPSVDLGHRASPAESFLMSLNTVSDAETTEDLDRGTSTLMLAGTKRLGNIHAKPHAAPFQKFGVRASYNTAGTELPAKFVGRRLRAMPANTLSPSLGSYAGSSMAQDDEKENSKHPGYITKSSSSFGFPPAYTKHEQSQSELDRTLGQLRRARKPENGPLFSNYGGRSF